MTWEEYVESLYERDDEEVYEENESDYIDDCQERHYEDKYNH